MSEPTAIAAPVEPQQKPKHSRAQLFAMAGERRYLIDKLGAELQVIYAELDQERPAYPPQTPAPEAQKETQPPNG